jgi:hypothetical protein
MVCMSEYACGAACGVGEPTGAGRGGGGRVEACVEGVGGGGEEEVGGVVGPEEEGREEVEDGGGEVFDAAWVR